MDITTRFTREQKAAVAFIILGVACYNLHHHDDLDGDGYSTRRLADDAWLGSGDTKQESESDARTSLATGRLYTGKPIPTI